jgi:UDP-sugar transporter A1/2/3
MVDLKALSFMLLVVQNTLLGIVSKYSRSTKYNATSAVMLIELFKLLLCLTMVTITKGSIVEMARSVNREVIGDREGFKKMIILALLYAGQNTVSLLSFDYVDVATYNIVYQLKIVTTALFMVVLLKRTFNTVQWICMISLMIGVSICSHSRPTAPSGKSSSFVGILMVVGLSVNSGIAAAYFEKVLKTHKPHQTFPNAIDPLWKTNIQLAAVSVGATFMGNKDYIYIIGRITVLFLALGVIYAACKEDHFSFFEGYNKFTYWVVCLQAFGGLIIAAVVRYSDNIVKNFGTALSLVLSCILSNYLFNTTSSGMFYVGVALVVGSVVIYGDKRFHGTAKTKLPKTLPITETNANIQNTDRGNEDEIESFLKERQLN